MQGASVKIYQNMVLRKRFEVAPSYLAHVL